MWYTTTISRCCSLYRKCYWRTNMCSIKWWNDVWYCRRNSIYKYSFEWICIGTISCRKCSIDIISFISVSEFKWSIRIVEYIISCIDTCEYTLNEISKNTEFIRFCSSSLDNDTCTVAIIGSCSRIRYHASRRNWSKINFSLEIWITSSAWWRSAFWVDLKIDIRTWSSWYTSCTKNSTCCSIVSFWKGRSCCLYLCPCVWGSGFINHTRSCFKYSKYISTDATSITDKCSCISFYSGRRWTHFKESASWHIHTKFCDTSVVIKDVSCMDTSSSYCHGWREISSCSNISSEIIVHTSYHSKIFSAKVMIYLSVDLIRLRGISAYSYAICIESTSHRYKIISCSSVIYQWLKIPWI